MHPGAETPRQRVEIDARNDALVLRLLGSRSVFGGVLRRVERVEERVLPSGRSFEWCPPRRGRGRARRRRFPRSRRRPQGQGEERRREGVGGGRRVREGVPPGVFRPVRPRPGPRVRSARVGGEEGERRRREALPVERGGGAERVAGVASGGARRGDDGTRGVRAGGRALRDDGERRLDERRGGGEALAAVRAAEPVRGSAARERQRAEQRRDGFGFSARRRVGARDEDATARDDEGRGRGCCFVFVFVSCSCSRLPPRRRGSRRRRGGIRARGSLLPLRTVPRTRDDLRARDLRLRDLRSGRRRRRARRGSGRRGAPPRARARRGA